MLIRFNCVTGMRFMLYQPRLPLTVKIGFRPVRESRSLLLILLFAALINLLFPRYYVLGHSMEPQLHEYDWLFTINSAVPTNSIRRGDIVVLASPYDEELAVKRVIGLPGETITVAGGQVFVDGAPLVEQYIHEAPRYSGEWTVDAGQYFVLGDNRNHSLDSADYGPVDMGRIRGTVRLRLWPPADFGLFTHPDYDGAQAG